MLFKELSKIFCFLEKREPLPIRATINDVPYYSQWESPSLVSKIIRGEISAKEDPLWKRSGARSPEEYELWARNMCGMVCLKMIIKHKLGRTIPILDLGGKGLEYGVYILRPDTIDGMYYSSFVKFIKKEFDLNAKVIGSMSIKRILRELAHGNYIIASVSHKIRDPNSKPPNKGGHLVLLLGYDLERRTILFHNPSGDTDESQKYAEISFPQFENFFARRGLVIEK